MHQTLESHWCQLPWLLPPVQWCILILPGNLRYLYLIQLLLIFQYLQVILDVKHHPYPFNLNVLFPLSDLLICNFVRHFVTGVNIV